MHLHILLTLFSERVRRYQNLKLLVKLYFLKVNNENISKLTQFRKKSDIRCDVLSWKNPAFVEENALSNLKNMCKVCKVLLTKYKFMSPKMFLLLQI